MTTLWLYLKFPALQLDSLFLQQQQTGLPDAPHRLSEISADRPTPPPLCLLDASTLLIKQLNRSASHKGIKAGMTLSMACALCHELQVLPYQTEQELHYLQQIAALLYQISADIALDPPNALWLRIEPMLVLYGGLNAYLAKLSQQLAPLQLMVNQAVANTAAAAKLLCFSQPGFISSAPEQILAALKKCPLDQSQLSQSASGKKVLQQLQSMGLVNLGQVLAIPRAELGRRFSADLVALLDELIGQRPTVREFYQPPEQFCQSLELLYQLEHSQQLQAPLAYLLQLLQNYLQLRDQHCYQLLLKLELRDHPPLQLSLQSACGEYLKSRWLALFQLKLQQLKLPAPLLKMQLSANQTTARNGDNLSLFDARARGAVARALDNPAEIDPQQPAPLSLADALRLRSLLTAKLGAERVQQPISQADHRPELANGCRELTFNQSAVAGALDDRNTEPNKRAADILPLRPALLLAEPIPLRMQLQLQPGLERIQTGWWDQHPVQRDYYIGRNAEGQWCWAFKNASGWYLQGYFA
ncbi:MAG: DNA polymerase Y family protein [Gammaproteobacteria bacterium]|nr:DNA polymerase Y family protein [Gammaproteobacteria bacterium]